MAGTCTIVMVGVAVLSLSLLFLSSNAKLIDLSHVHGPQTFMSPGNDPYFNKQVFAKDFIPGVYVEYGTITTGEHGGTHIDAPVHFKRNGQLLHEIPLEFTVLDGVMIDVSDDCNDNENYVMPLSKLHDWELKYGQIPSGAAIVLSFGWSSHFHDIEKYIGSNNKSDIGTYKYPSLSPASGEWLYTERNARLLAVDTMSPDLERDRFPIHLRFLGNNRLIVENVRDPGQLPARGFRLHAAPVKYLDSTGTQIRLYAMTYDHLDNGKPNMTASAFLTFTFGSLLIFLKF